MQERTARIDGVDDDAQCVDPVRAQLGDAAVGDGGAVHGTLTEQECPDEESRRQVGSELFVRLQLRQEIVRVTEPEHLRPQHRLS